MSTLAVCREYGLEVVLLFPEMPGSRKPRECLAYSESKGFYSENYDFVFVRSKPAKARDYRPVIKQLKKQKFEFNIIQQASPIMHETRKQLAETFSEINQWPQKIEKPATTIKTELKQ